MLETGFFHLLDVNNFKSGHDTIFKNQGTEIYFLCDFFQAAPLLLRILKDWKTSRFIKYPLYTILRRSWLLCSPRDNFHVALFDFTKQIDLPFEWTPLI
jgi:hypothetical protein